MGPDDKEFDDILGKLFGEDGKPFVLGEFDFSESKVDDDANLKRAYQAVNNCIDMFLAEGFNFKKSLDLTMKVVMIFAKAGGDEDGNS